MKYAPIIIPTLNRKEHLERCICSLKSNSWAKYTDLLISVDYPNEDKYIDGYTEVCKYLENGIEGFEKVNIIFQKENLGVCGNAEYLRQLVISAYDRYIYIEDDNEVSKNFIEYMDKGLDLFENDSDIIAICSNAPDSNRESLSNELANVVMMNDFSAYGYGSWVRKEKDYYNIIQNRNLFINYAKDRKIVSLFFKRNMLFALQDVILRKGTLYSLSNGMPPVIDQTIKMYMIAEKKYTIAALSRKTRNWGYDGSGENCGKCIQKLENIVLDNDDSFDFRISTKSSVTYKKYIFSPEKFCREIIVLFKLLRWRILDGK